MARVILPVVEIVLKFPTSGVPPAVILCAEVTPTRVISLLL